MSSCFSRNVGDVDINIITTLVFIHINKSALTPRRTDNELLLFFVATQIFKKEKKDVPLEFNCVWL